VASGSVMKEYHTHGRMARLDDWSVEIQAFASLLVGKQCLSTEKVQQLQLNLRVLS